MNITLQTNEDGVSAVLHAIVTKTDYAPKVEKSLKMYRQKASVPGFRPGKVPATLIKKMYGNAIIAEEINTLLNEKVVGYIKENKIDILGEPLPRNESAPVDFEQEELEFLFDLALAPQFEIAMSKKDKLPYYEIAVSEEQINEHIDTLRRRTGKYELADSVEDKAAMLKGALVELNEDGTEKEGGIRLEDALLMPQYLKDEAQQALFMGKKKEDVIVFNPTKAYADSAAEVSALLKIEKDAVSEHTGDFSYSIVEITLYVPGEMNQELFDSVYEKGTVTDEAAFREKVAAELSVQSVPECDYLFLADARKALEKKAGELKFSNELLTRIILAHSKEEKKEVTDEELVQTCKDLTWHLIREKLVRNAEIKINEEDVKQAARDRIKAQFTAYGYGSLPDDIMTQYAENLLQKEDQVEQLVDYAVTGKLINVLKEQVTLNRKTVSAEEFQTIAYGDKK